MDKKDLNLNFLLPSLILDVDCSWLRTIGVKSSAVRFGGVMATAVEPILSMAISSNFFKRFSFICSWPQAHCIHHRS